MRKLISSLIVSGFFFGIYAQSSSIEFYDSTGTNVTGKIRSANGQMIIVTPSDEDAVSVKNSDLNVKGTVNATSFKGSGDGLTIARLDSIISQLEAVKKLLDGKADTGSAEVIIDKIPWSKLTQIPADLKDGDQVGITEESDPTVPENLKNGVSWSEIKDIPEKVKSGEEKVIIAEESDPTVPDNLKNGVSWSEISGIPSEIKDGDQVGIRNESDPTVPKNLKDGVSWSEIKNIPSEIKDGDQVGIRNESDPTVPKNLKDGVSWSEIKNIPEDIKDGDQGGGITKETDPTIPDYLKDGVSWGEIGEIPDEIFNGDDVGITEEKDPTIPDYLKDGVSWGEIGDIPDEIFNGDDVGAETGGSWDHHEYVHFNEYGGTGWAGCGATWVNHPSSGYVFVFVKAWARIASEGTLLRMQLGVGGPDDGSLDYTHVGTETNSGGGNMIYSISLQGVHEVTGSGRTRYWVSGRTQKKSQGSGPKSKVYLEDIRMSAIFVPNNLN